MEISDIVRIDLSEFGVDGVVEMGMPSVRQINNMKNEVSRVARIRARGSQGDVDASIEGLNQGDMEILTALMYVRRAPFKCTLDGFLDFCDMMNEKSPLSDSILLARMEAVAAEMERVRSPFVSSRVQETVSSE